MVLAVQIVGLLFGMFMIYYSFLNYKRKDFTTKEFTAWSAVWVFFTIAALFPNVVDPLIIKIGFLRALDLFVIAGFIFFGLAIFHTYSITRHNQNQLEKLVREIALKGKRK